MSGDEQVILQQLLCHVSLRIMSKGELIFVYFFVCFCLFFFLINACLAEYATEVNAQNIERAKQEWQKKVIAEKLRRIYRIVSDRKNYLEHHVEIST